MFTIYLVYLKMVLKGQAEKTVTDFLRQGAALHRGLARGDTFLKLGRLGSRVQRSDRFDVVKRNYSTQQLVSLMATLALYSFQLICARPKLKNKKSPLIGGCVDGQRS